MSKPLAILTADIHITNKNPVGRSDSYLETLTDKLLFIREVQQNYNIPVLDAGDVFDKATTTPEVINMALSSLPKNFYTIAGNHDMKYANTDLFEKTTLCTVDKANTGQSVIAPYQTVLVGDISVTGFPYGCYDLSQVNWDEVNRGKYKIALMHIMTYSGGDSFVGCTDDNAAVLLKKMEGFDCVVTGHNHKRFKSTDSNRILVNPGSIMRITADQIDYQPKINILYDDMTIKYISIPINDVVSRQHIEKVKERDERIDSFVKSLAGEVEVELSFQKTLTNIINMGNVPEEVTDIINKVLEEN